MGLFNQSLSRMLSFCIVIVAGIGAFHGIAKADLVAYWHFTTPILSDPFPALSVPQPADLGSGFVNCTQWGFNTNYQIGFGPGNSTLNALPGTPTSDSYRLGFSGSAGSGTPIDIEFSMAGYEGLELSFIQQNFNNGIRWFGETTWSWSTDGVTFTELDGVSTVQTNSNWELKVIDLSPVSDLDNASIVTIRMIPSDIQDSGIPLPHAPGFEWDNIQLNANTVPAPGALTLIGIAGVCGSRRRRNS